jgi:hypothetical protein
MWGAGALDPWAGCPRTQPAQSPTNSLPNRAARSLACGAAATAGRAADSITSFHYGCCLMTVVDVARAGGQSSEGMHFEAGNIGVSARAGAYARGRSAVQAVRTHGCRRAS